MAGLWRFALLLCTIAWSIGAMAQSAENKLKAAFVYNFAKFVSWPAEVFDSHSSLAICFIGTADMSSAMTTITNRTAQGKPLKLLTDVKPASLSNCAIVFIGQSEKSRLGSWLQAARSTTALTVSDIADFSRSGGMIELTSDDVRVAFDINLEETDRAGLRVNPQLLRVAKNVYGARNKP